MTENPWVIAHRGASQEMPENTLAAFKRAIEIGAHCLEVDVHLSKDGVPVCRHDAALGPDCAMLSELTVKDIKRRTEQVRATPTLEQLLSMVRSNIHLFIELKSEGCHSPRRLVTAVTELLSYYRGFATHQPFIGSFSATILRELQGRWPVEKTVGIAEFERDVPNLMAFKPAIIALDHRLALACSQRLIPPGTTVWSWTVDDIGIAQQLISKGVTGIITNDPRTMVQMLCKVNP